MDGLACAQESKVAWISHVQVKTLERLEQSVRASLIDDDNLTAAQLVGVAVCDEEDPSGLSDGIVVNEAANLTGQIPLHD